MSLLRAYLPASIRNSTQWQDIVFGVLGLGSLLLFAWLPDSYFKMRSWPWSILWQFGWLTVGTWAVWRLRQFQQPFQSLGYGFDRILVTLILVLLLSSSLSTFRGLALANCLLVFAYIIALYLFRNRLSPKWSCQLWTGFVVVSAMSSLVALIMWQPTPDMWLSDSFHTAIRNRAPLGHHNFSGGYFSLTLPVAIAFALAHSGWRRWVGAIAGLSLAIALYSSGSRGAWLGTSLTVFVSLGFALWQSHGKQRWKLMTVGGVAICAIVLLFLSNPRIRTLDIHRQGPTLDRILMVKAAGNILRHKPLLGVGPGNMAHVYNLYRPIESGAGLEMAQQLHNLPAHLAGELGLAGLAIYGWLLFAVFRLWRQLKQLASDPADQWLLNGIGLGSLSYALASLTDYQLENIPISAALSCLLLLLLLKADQLRDEQDSQLAIAGSSFSVPVRRVLSLFVLGVLGLQLSVWLATSTALYSNHLAIEKANDSQLAEVEADFDRAAKLNPWDPTPSALMAQLFYDVSRVAPNPQDRRLLTQQSIRQYLNAHAASPNDAWFNNNLALLYLESGDLIRAEAYAERTVALYPRTYNYTYYTLGLTYLAQAKIDQAIDAFALELLSIPDFITMKVWDSAPFTALQPRVLESAMEHYERVLDLLAPDHRYADYLYEQSLLIRWWVEGVLPEAVSWSRLRPIVQAVIQAESQPDTALMIVEQALEETPDIDGLELFRAWLVPEVYLEQYLQTADLPEPEMTAIRADVLEKRVLKDWLSASTGTPSDRKRGSLSLAYRNISANGVNSMLRPDAISYSVLPNQVLQLFVAMPRDLPVLDEVMESIRVDRLDLVHPTRSGFRLPALDLPSDEVSRD